MSEQANPAMIPGDDGPAGRAPWELPSELKSLEARLAALVPRDDRLDRERLIFLAGQASVDATLWPRAFAAMTAVAAALFIMLLTRSSVTDTSSPTQVSNVASGNRPLEARSQPLSASGDVRADVLSAGDARSGDIEQLLGRRAEGYAGTVPIDDRDRPALTPAAWRQVIGNAESPGLPAGESSSLPTYRGIKS